MGREYVQHRSLRILSVTSMVVFYALEAVMIQAWPFAGVDLLWTGLSVMG